MDSEVNFNVLPGEIIMRCPYYENHLFRESRAHYHLGTCRSQYETERKKLGLPMDISICSNFYKHHIRAVDMEDHKESCDKKVLRDSGKVAAIPIAMSLDQSGRDGKPSTEFKVPGTEDTIQVNRASKLACTSWENPQDTNLLKGRMPSKIPVMIGTIPKEIVEKKPEKPQPHFSYVENAKRGKIQPMGLTKSQRKKWQEENLARAKKAMEEDKARELFRSMYPEMCPKPEDKA